MKINYDLVNGKNSKIFEKVYDYIIIGSGPAGVSFYKNIISKKKKSNILIIEDGDYHNKKYKKVFSKHLKIKLKSRAFTVGGSSTIWSNISSYFEEFEMKSRWNNEKKNLWPLKYDSLIAEYKKVDKKFNFFFDELKKKKFKIPFEVRQFIGSTYPLNFKKFIDHKEIDLIYNCKICSIDENSKLTRAYTDRDKQYFSAKKMIVCCGGIESINLIKNSINEKKIKNIQNKNIVGKFFMDHPKFNLGYLQYPRVDLIKKFELTKKKNNIQYYGISLRKNLQKKFNLLNSYVRFEKSSGKIVKLLSKINVPILKNIIKKKISYKVRVFCEMEPNINNLVTLKKKKTYVKLRLSKNDKRTIDFLSSEIKRYFSHNPKFEKNLKINIARNKIEDASHHMGGLRYSNNNKLSNVDRNLKIRGLKNIYICSSAVFPTSGSVNPTMTICALSSRLANFLSK